MIHTYFALKLYTFIWSVNKQYTIFLHRRISELTAEVSETRRKREADLRELATTTRELANMSDAEKQRIIVQISSVQTDLKRTMDERYFAVTITNILRASSYLIKFKSTEPVTHML